MQSVKSVGEGVGEMPFWCVFVCFGAREYTLLKWSPLVLAERGPYTVRWIRVGGGGERRWIGCCTSGGCDN